MELTYDIMDFSSLLSDLTAQFSSAKKHGQTQSAASNTKLTKEAVGNKRLTTSKDGVNDVFGEAGQTLAVKKRRLEVDTSAATPISGPARLDSQRPAASNDDDTGTPLAIGDSTAPTSLALPSIVQLDESLSEAPRVPALFSSMMAGIQSETLASKLSRPVALDLFKNSSGALAAAQASISKPSANRTKLPRNYLHSTHGLKNEDGGKRHDMKPMGLTAALAVSAKRTRAQTRGDGMQEETAINSRLRRRVVNAAKKSLGKRITADQLASLHSKWSAYAWEAAEAHARVTGISSLTSPSAGGGKTPKGGAVGDDGPGGVIIETLLQKGTALRDASASSAGSKASRQPMLTSAELQRVLSSSSHTLLRRMDLHFARLIVTRCPRKPDLVGTAGFVLIDGARTLRLAVVGSDGGTVQRMTVPKEGSWFLLQWPSKGSLLSKASKDPSPVQVELVGDSMIRAPTSKA